MGWGTVTTGIAVFLHSPQAGWGLGNWNLDLTLLIPAAAVVYVYLRGLDRWQERTRPHSDWRTASFLTGVAVTLLALESPLDWLAEHHLTFHMIQHELLMMIAVPLVLLGAPTTPLLKGLPRPLRRVLVEPLARGHGFHAVYRALTHPVVAVGGYVVILAAWHFIPGWYAAALQTRWTHDVQHLTFLLAGGLIWWVVIDPRPLHSRLDYLPRIVFLLAASTPKAFMGAFIAFAAEPIYRDAYGSVIPAVGLTIEQDHVLGGLIMWMPSQMMYLAAIAAVFFFWAQRSEREQAAIEAALAAERAAARPDLRSSGGSPAT